MKKIECCRNCVPPKRHSGCHATCKEYKEERQEFDEEKELIEKNKKHVVINYVNNKVSKFEHFKRKHKRH